MHRTKTDKIIQGKEEMQNNLLFTLQVYFRFLERAFKSVMYIELQCLNKYVHIFIQSLLI